MMTLLTGKDLRSKNKIYGFTLIELIIVVGIVLIFLIFSIPVIKGTYQNNLIKNATRELAHSLVYARDLAILEGVNYEVNFDTTDNSYNITSKPDTRLDKAMMLDSILKTSRRNYLPENIYFAHLSNPKITFYPNGSSEDFLIHLEDTKNNIYTVVVKGVYSQIKVLDI